MHLSSFFNFPLHMKTLLFLFTGLVKSDPKLPDSVLMPPPSPRQEVSVFDDEDKAQVVQIPQSRTAAL